MPIEETQGCAVCGATLSHVGILYNGTKVVRILACENGHFIQASTPQEVVAWIDLATMGKFSAKLYDSDLIPTDLQVLWVRRGDAWTRTKVQDLPSADVNLGEVNSCPFCHSTNTVVMRDAKQYFVCCDACNVYGPESEDLRNALDKWNSA